MKTTIHPKNNIKTTSHRTDFEIIYQKEEISYIKERLSWNLREKRCRNNKLRNTLTIKILTEKMIVGRMMMIGISCLIDAKYELVHMRSDNDFVIFCFILSLLFINYFKVSFYKKERKNRCNIKGSTIHE